MAKMKRISDSLLGGFSGAAAGTSALGGLGQAGLIGAGAISPWAWGLVGGGALLGGISSMLSEDDVSGLEKDQMRISNDLGREQIKGLQMDNRLTRQSENRRKGVSGYLGTMMGGAKKTPFTMPPQAKPISQRIQL